MTVQTQPSSPKQSCSVTNSSNTLAGENVENVSVTCTTNTYFIGGQVNGLLGNSNLVLQNNNGDDLLLITDSGAFAFVTALTDGGSYSVTVLSQPNSPLQTCVISSGGSGSINGDDVITVMVDCEHLTAMDHVYRNGFESSQ